MENYIFLFMLLLFIIPIRINGDYLHNVGVIVDKQLENPDPEDSQDLFDNIGHYNTLLKDLAQNVKNKDPLILKTAREFWVRGIPGFINFADLPYLQNDFNWDDEKTEIFTNLIQNSKTLWSELTTELNKVGIFR